MTTTQQLAAGIIWEEQAAGIVKPADLAQALDDEGYLMPNLPKPTINDCGQPEWNVFDTTIWTQTGAVYCRDVDNTEWEAYPADVVAYAYALLAAAAHATQEKK